METCQEYRETLEILKCVLTNKPLEDSESYNWTGIYNELKNHAIAPMVGYYLKRHPDTDGFEKNFIKRCSDTVVSNIHHSVNAQREEASLCELFKSNNINPCILKGSAASFYYPDKLSRTFGDVDILVDPNDYEKAAKLMVENDYEQVSELYEDPRNVTFKHCTIEIELHHCFFKDDNIAADDELYAVLDRTREVYINGTTIYILPDRENGLVLIDHIRQHIFGGLGLRQILDWYMFCFTACDDEFWYSQMNEYLQRFELKQLAMCVATHIPHPKNSF